MSKLFKLCFLLLFSFSLFQESYADRASASASHPRSSVRIHKSIPAGFLGKPNRKLIKILAIDGGGIRGVIPLKILKDIEKRLPKGKHLSECFDIIAGTSTGGIIALALTTPTSEGTPKYTAGALLEAYKDMGKSIFSRSLGQILISGSGWWGAKYSSNELENHLKEFFGLNKFSHSLTNVLIPAYEIEEDKAFMFKSSRAKTELSQDSYAKDLARATSAAPTYFKPAQIKDLSGRDLALIDGGVAVNNPALCAAVYAIELYGHEVDFFIVSLGTGTNYGASAPRINVKEVENAGLLEWAKKIVSLMMHAAVSVVDYQMYYALDYNYPLHYIRIEPILEPEHMGMDEADEENILALENYADKVINDHEKDFDYIAESLTKATFHPYLLSPKPQTFE